MICSTIPTLPSKATRAGLIVGAALLLTLQPLQAGFSVRPTSLHLTKPGAVATLYLNNNTGTTNVYQVGPAEWTDRSVPTAVAPTKDLTVSPRVLRLRPGEIGRVRITAARPGIAGSGKAYRILARQVAPAQPGGDLKVGINIQFNVPLLTAQR
jgi:P pilus assembly chaperone PapD